MKLEELFEQFVQQVQSETESGWQGDAQAANRHVDKYLGHLKVGGVKIIQDGSPQGKTVFLSKPYHHPIQGHPSRS